MKNILYLVHRIPYPPNKGDKVRSFNLLRHLAKKNRIYLGAFADSEDEKKYIKKCEEYCEEVMILKLSMIFSIMAAGFSIFTKTPLSVAFYNTGRLRQWINFTLKTKNIDVIIIFSGVMAQYINVDSLYGKKPIITDFVDMDSLKWKQYSEKRNKMTAWLFELEGRKLLSFEKSVAAISEYSVFVTEQEARLFRMHNPEISNRILAIENGVDFYYFSPDFVGKSPFLAVDGKVLVFTGAMDYWPNVDAVSWFVTDILPLIWKANPNVFFFIVGRNPSNQVLSLASDKVIVTGEVPDVRPYLQGADVVAAPLRIARGLQNKVLEAMSMGRPVVTSTLCASAFASDAQRCLIAAVDADEFHSRIVELLNNKAKAEELGNSARRAVLASYSWDRNLSRFDSLLAETPVASA